MVRSSYLVPPWLAIGLEILSFSNNTRHGRPRVDPGSWEGNFLILQGQDWDFDKSSKDILPQGGGCGGGGGGGGG